MTAEEIAMGRLYSALLMRCRKVRDKKAKPSLKFQPEGHRVIRTNSRGCVYR